jgi:hypothetical protein
MHPERPIVRRAIVALTPDRRRQLLEVLDYIESRHYWIDPDMFDIDRRDVATLGRMLGAGDDAGPAVISVAFDDVVALETCVMAADTYAHRKGERALCSLTDEEFTDLDRWVSDVRQRFVTPLADT